MTNVNSTPTRGAVSDSLAATEIIRDLIAVLHPGAVGLIHNQHGSDRGAAASEAVMAAKAFLARDGAEKIYHGTLSIDGICVSGEFLAPAGATRAEMDAAFMAALAQQCEIEVEPSTAPDTRVVGAIAPQ